MVRRLVLPVVALAFAAGIATNALAAQRMVLFEEITNYG